MFSKPDLLLAKLRRPISLRSHLIILSVALAIPLLVFAVWVIVPFDRQQRETFQKGATQRTLALLTAVDTELKGSITTLEALATSRHFDNDDLRAFRDDASRVLQSQPDWLTVNVAAPSGQQLMNLIRPASADLPMTRERESFNQALRTGKPAVGRLVLGPVTKQQEFSVRVPIARNGVIKYVLSAVVKPQAIRELLLAQRLPSDWVGVVLDGNRRFVTRTVNPERSLGELASEGLRAALDRQDEGWFQGTTIEGWNVYTAYNHSTFSGWTVALGIPAAAVEATFRRSILYLAGLGFIMLALAIALASITSRKTVTSIHALLSMAEDLGLGKRPAAATASAAHSVPGTIGEIENLREAFFTASRLIQERSEQRDQMEATLRQVTERLELAQEAANVGSFERDLVTNEIKWSASQEKLYGLASGSFDGKLENWAKHVHPDDIGPVEMAVHHAAETQTSIDVEFRIIRPDGETRWLSSQARVLANESGARRMIGVNIDITEQKRAKEALREADHRKDEFLAILGHELRNPLGIISTCVQLLRRKGPPDPSLQELRETIERQVAQMARLLDDLLDVSRIGRGQIRLKSEPCDLAAIVRETVEDCRGLFQESALRLELEVSDQSLWVMGDSTRLSQIIANVLHNANKFTDSGGCVTVRLNEVAGHGAAMLTIRDTGIGMDAEMLAQAFQPFSQAEHSIDRSRGGLGLGLALVKGLVELHEGKVSIRSDGLGRGSELIIRLPLVDAPVQVGKTVELERKRARSYRLLIIEDNFVAAKSMQIFLTENGHRVEVAHNGLDGIEVAGRFQPDVVLCDIGLPGMDGYAVCHALRQQFRFEETYLIAITGYGQEEDERRAREAGFDIHITKPLNLDELERLLSNWIAPEQRVAV